MLKASRSALTLALAVALLATAGTARADDSYGIEIRIIEATNQGGGIDPALKRFSSDFKNLPFKSYRQVDFHAKKLRTGETVSMEFPGRRFLKVKANGTRDGKHRFRLSIDALKFSTSVRIPDNGTLIVGGPKSGDGVILLAITARATP